MSEGANPTSDENTETATPPVETNPSPSADVKPDVAEENVAENGTPEDEVGSKTPAHLIPRFKELIEEKNSYKAEIEKIRQEAEEYKKQLESGSQNKRQQEEPVIRSNNSEMQKYDEFFDKSQKLSFKAATEYKSIEDLFYDFRAPMIDSVLQVVRGLDQKEAQTKAEADKEYQTNLKHVDKFLEEEYPGNQVLKEEFGKFRDEELKEGSRDLVSMLRVFLKLKGQVAQDTEQTQREEIQTKISKGKGGPAPKKTGGYDPAKHRSKSMSDILGEVYHR